MSRSGSGSCCGGGSYRAWQASVAAPPAGARTLAAPSTDTTTSGTGSSATHAPTDIALAF